MNINPKITRRQAEICLALIRELDRAAIELKQPADQYLAHFYRRHREYGARDRRFLSDAVFSWFRWRGWLKTPENENIAAAILLDADELPPQLEHLSEITPRQFLQQVGRDSPLSGVAPGAKTDVPPSFLKPLATLTLEEKAVYLRELLNASSLQIDQVGRGVPARLGGARQPTGEAWAKLSGRAAHPEDSPYLLKFKSSELTPAWFPEVVFIPEGKDRELHLKQCVEAFQSRPPTWLRLPSSRTQYYLSLLSNAGLEVARHPFLNQAVFIKGGKGFDSGRFPQIQIQDLASQCAGLCCAPPPGEHWWDMCAGAGGKSLHLADLMRDKGGILATDIRPEILNQMAKRLRQNKYQSIRPLLWDSKTDPLPGQDFDGVLVDAPCSGIGAWHRNPDARWRMDAGQITEYAGAQKRLLEIAAGKIKPGGRLVYSTCTLTRIENADVINAFLEQHPEFRFEKLINPLNHEPANGIVWIWPWEWNSNGMFIAVMKKC